MTHIQRTGTRRLLAVMCNPRHHDPAFSFHVRGVLLSSYHLEETLHIKRVDTTIFKEIEKPRAGGPGGGRGGVGVFLGVDVDIKLGQI